MFDSLRTELRKLRKRLGPRRHKSKPVVLDLDEGFDYAKLASQCRTVNEYNQLHIGLENVCTPRELAEIAKLARSRWGFKATRSWLKNYQTWTPDLFELAARL